MTRQCVTRAQQLLETTELPVEHIVHGVGFGTPLSMRQQFAAQLGTSPSDYRRTFCNAGRASLCPGALLNRAGIPGGSNS
jgi:transcriptional regulator GlxA family with amidase domain